MAVLGTVVRVRGWFLELTAQVNATSILVHSLGCQERALQRNFLSLYWHVIVIFLLELPENPGRGACHLGPENTLCKGFKCIFRLSQEPWILDINFLKF